MVSESEPKNGLAFWAPGTQIPEPADPRMALPCPASRAKDTSSRMASLPYRAPHFARHLLGPGPHPAPHLVCRPFRNRLHRYGNLEPFVYLCFLSFPFASLCLPVVSLLSPFVSLCRPLSPFCFLLSPFVSLLCPFCFPVVSLLSPSVSLLSPCCLPVVSLLSPCCFTLFPCCSPVVPLLLGLVAGNTFTLQLRRRCERIGFRLAGSQHTRNCR